MQDLRFKKDEKITDGGLSSGSEADGGEASGSNFCGNPFLARPRTVVFASDSEAIQKKRKISHKFKQPY